MDNQNESGGSASNPVVENLDDDSPDLGLGNSSSNSSRRNVSSIAAGGQNGSDHRREENPFSFKKFLNQDHGARRKEYPVDGGPVYHHGPILPDFVQDHMIIEQSYMNNSPPHASIPFDLPLAAADERHDPSVPLSLPDFLSDGPIRNQRLDDDHDLPGPSNGHLSPRVPSMDDLEHLQREVDSLRRQVREKNQRIQRLESDVSLLRRREARDDDSLEQALQQVEINLQQTTKRLQNAEASVQKLKTENRNLRSQLAQYEGVTEGASASIPLDTQRLANDLKLASASAEVHALALLSGIEKLKILASSLEESPVTSKEPPPIHDPSSSSAF